MDDIDKVWQFYEGTFAASCDDVKEYLKNYEGVFIYQGISPETSISVTDRTFSLINSDSTPTRARRSVFKFFYPRMSSGSVVISHDYITAPGVKKAFDDFFSGKAEPVIETAGSQCLVVNV